MRPAELLSRLRGRMGWPRLAFFSGGLVLFLSYLFVLPPIRTGDGLEYLYTLQAWSDHLSPDLRDVDVARMDPILEQNKLPSVDPFTFFIRTARGQYYSMHFWFYPLLALPAKLLLRLTGGNQLAALQATNALLFLAALYAVLFRDRSSLWKRLALAGFSAVSPVLWYLKWTHPEVMTWAFVLLALVQLNSRNYGWAALWASCGATQNPPVMFLAALAVALSLEEKNLKLTIRAAAGAPLAFLPNVFSYAVFGTLNPIADTAAVDRTLISLGRTIGFLTDLNQGMLPYIPVLLLLAVVALVRVFIRRSYQGMGVAATLLVMILSCEVAANWNSGCEGMIRYAVWMVPLLAWLVAEYLPEGRTSKSAVVIGLALQSLLLAWHSQHVASDTYCTQTPIARFVLDHAPALYLDPDPEIFGERQIGSEQLYRAFLPLMYVSSNGDVRKILTDAPGLAQLPDIVDVEPEYMRQVSERYRGWEGLFYLNPPAGAVKDPRKGAPAPLGKELRRILRLRIVDFPNRVSQPEAAITMDITNRADYPFLERRIGMLPALTVSYRVSDRQERTLVEGTIPALQGRGSLKPGLTVEFRAAVGLPREKGEYILEFAPTLVIPAWTHRPLLGISVEAVGAGGYAASIRTKPYAEARESRGKLDEGPGLR